MRRNAKKHPFIKIDPGSVINLDYLCNPRSPLNFAEFGAPASWYCQNVFYNIILEKAIRNVKYRIELITNVFT